MKRLLLIVTAFAAAWAGACSGGGSSTTTTPPPPAGFTNASLSGAYVFSLSGSTEDPADDEIDNFSRVGVFIADGKGDIQTTGGVEDQHQFGSDNVFAITGGSYVVNADGRGTLSLTTSGGTVQYSISLASSSTGYMVDMISGDTETGSGSFTLQTATTIATGTYVFDFSGIDPGSGNPLSIVGDFIPSAAGSGSFAAGSFEDVNDGGTLVTKAIISGGDYEMDNTSPGTGRGLATLGGIDYVFYVIDGQHLQMMDIDPDQVTGGTILGEASAQQAGTPNDVNAFNASNFVFVMGGSAAGEPLTRGGRLTATGGNLSAILMDYNNAGVVTSIPLLNAGTITLDGDNSGRGTITFTDTAKNTGSYTFVFYLSSATQGVIQQDSNANVTEDGTLLAQMGAPFSSSSLAANYALNLSGVDNNGEEDFVGSFATAASSPNGLLDFNEFGQGKQFTNNQFNGVITVGGDGTGSTGTHSTFVAGINGTPSTTINFFAYIANPSTILVMGTSTNRVIAGALTAQTP